MYITRDVDYAIRSILFLSLQENFSATKRQISIAMKIPPFYLSKIAQQLYRSRIIDITKGPKGHYRLLKQPEDITLLEVVEGIKGDILISYCVDELKKCFRKERCYVNEIWRNLTQLLKKELEEITFKDILEKEACYIKNSK